MIFFKIVLIFLLSFQIIHNGCSSEDVNDDYTGPIYDKGATSDSCQKISFDSGEDYYKCCYEQYTCPAQSGIKKKVHQCEAYSKDDYEKVSEYIKLLKKIDTNLQILYKNINN